MLAVPVGIWAGTTLSGRSPGAITASLILGACLRERVRSSGPRQQVVLFNVATIVRVLIGALAVHAALVIVALLAVGVLIVPRLFAAAVHHPVVFGNYVRCLGWTARWRPWALRSAPAWRATTRCAAPPTPIAPATWRRDAAMPALPPPE